MAKEKMYTVAACTGETLLVPESRLEAVLQRNEELKQAMAEGWNPQTDPLPEKYAPKETEEEKAYYRKLSEARLVMYRVKKRAKEDGWNPKVTPKIPRKYGTPEEWELIRWYREQK